MADVYGATELMDISQAHIDSTIYLGDATLEFAETARFARAEGRSADVAQRQAASTSAAGKDCGGQAGMGGQGRAPDARLRGRMGAVPNVDVRSRTRPTLRPVFGQQIAWGESNATQLREFGDRRQDTSATTRTCSTSACAINRPRSGWSACHLTENLGRAAAACASPVCRRRCSQDESVLCRSRTSGRQARRREHPGDRRSGRLAKPRNQLKAFAAAAA